MQHRKPLIAVQRVRPDPQCPWKLASTSASMRSRRGLASFRLSASMPKVIYLVLAKPLFPLESWVFEHIRIFLPDGIKSVLLVGDMDGAALFLYVGGLIEERKLDTNRTVKIVQKIAPVFKDQIFVLVLCQLVVDVVELHLLGEIPLRNNADAVPAHLLVRDGLLGGAGNFCRPRLAFWTDADSRRFCTAVSFASGVKRMLSRRSALSFLCCLFAACSVFTCFACFFCNRIYLLFVVVQPLQSDV